MRERKRQKDGNVPEIHFLTASEPLAMETKTKCVWLVEKGGTGESTHGSEKADSQTTTSVGHMNPRN